MVTAEDLQTDTHALLNQGNLTESRLRTVAARAVSAALHRLLSVSYIRGHRYNKAYPSKHFDEQLLEFLLQNGDSQLRRAGLRLRQAKFIHTRAEYYLEQPFFQADAEECLELVDLIFRDTPTQ